MQLLKNLSIRHPIFVKISPHMSSLRERFRLYSSSNFTVKLGPRCVRHTPAIHRTLIINFHDSNILIHVKPALGLTPSDAPSKSRQLKRCLSRLSKIQHLSPSWHRARAVLYKRRKIYQRFRRCSTASFESQRAQRGREMQIRR